MREFHKDTLFPLESATPSLIPQAKLVEKMASGYLFLGLVTNILPYFYASYKNIK